MKKASRQPSAASEPPTVECPRCGLFYEQGAPHYGFCLGQKDCDECGEEPEKDEAYLEKCEVCKGVFCRGNEDEDAGCYNEHSCDDYRDPDENDESEEGE